MRELKSKILFVCVFALLVGAAPVALGDGDPGDPNKWVQFPDLSYDGMDVDVTYCGSAGVTMEIDNVGNYRSATDDQPTGGIFEEEDLKNKNLKWSQPPIEIDPMSETPVYCGWDELSWEEQNPIWYDCWNCPTQCHGDADCDGYVGDNDLTILQMAWPPNPYSPCADFDHDGMITVADLFILQNYWYTYPPADCPGRRTFWHLAADDFRCLGSIPITSIHWWGSHPGWEEPGSMPPEDLPIAWRIGFWSNVPAGFDVEYSHPEELLWQIEVPADRVESQWVGYDQFPERPSDTCFQYYVQLEENEWFWQGDFTDDTNDNIFWLSIAAVYEPNVIDPQYPWGWKTRPWSWMDDAVRFWMDEEPEPGIVLDPERNMIEPIEEPIFGESFDLAFELDTDPNYIKHEQPFTGIRDWPHYEDELSMATEDDIGEPNITRLVADDWHCDNNDPVTAAVWWGSYIDYTYEVCQGPPASLPVKPKYFWLTVWDDVPAGVDLPYSHPNDILWEYKAYDYDEVLVGYDKHPIGAPNEPVFRYSVRLPDPNWFCQDANDGIYWFSVVAVYDENVPNYDWGWTNHEHVYNDDAVASYVDANGAWVWEELYDQTEVNSVDMSFVLFTHPNPYYNCPDYNNDGIVNFIDYAYFADDWRWSGPLGGYNNSDLNCDGLVDLYDLAIFVRHWLESCQLPCP